MFTSFSIEHFRCFKHLEIKELERVNLIAGINNVGKTALLEALFMHIGYNNPQLSLVINIKRGMHQYSRSAEDLWGWLFHDRDTRQTISFLSHDHLEKSRELSLRLVEPETAIIANADNGSDDTSYMPTDTAQYELLMDFRAPDGSTASFTASLGEKGLETTGPRKQHPFRAIFLGTGPSGGEDAERFSKLEAKGRHEQIISMMRIVEPQLKRLSVLASAGQPEVYADLGLSQLIPVRMMGQGTGRLLTILLAIADSPQGFTLIDEVDNGLHYSILGKVWHAIRDLARELNAQVFATTHSRECISAAHETFSSESPYDFRLHRLERSRSTLEVIQYDKESLASALKEDLEVR